MIRVRVLTASKLSFAIVNTLLVRVRVGVRVTE